MMEPFDDRYLFLPKSKLFVPISSYSSCNSDLQTHHHSLNLTNFSHDCCNCKAVTILAGSTALA
jgi:hypothetical protein